MPLWAPNADVPSLETMAPVQKSPSYPTPNPLQDAARMSALKRLRHSMVKHCTAADPNSKPPVLAFERWMGRAALKRGLKSDVLIPTTDSIDYALVKDLARSLPTDAAKSIAEKLQEEAEEASKRVSAAAATRNEGDDAPSMKNLRKSFKAKADAVKVAAKSVEKIMKKFSGNDLDEKSTDMSLALDQLRKATAALSRSARDVHQAAGCSKTEDREIKITIDGSRRSGIFDVEMTLNGIPKKPYLSISASHLIKLIHLWNIQKGEGTKDLNYDDPLGIINALEPDERQLFSENLYCLLSRYEALKGAGYQAAVPGTAFDAANECGLGTMIECFASPLNCRYRRYCSAFPDVEYRFGSLGSFFDDEAFYPMEGSFEANPPFIPETMIAMGQKIDRLLSDPSRKALSFLVVVPAWGAGIQFCKSLENSKFARAVTKVAATEHVFCDGAQHTKPKSGGRQDPDMRPSSWDTAVILLQNDAGATRWPVNVDGLEKSFCKALREASKALPKDMATIGAWEGRGVANGGSMKRSRTQKKKYGADQNSFKKRRTQLDSKYTIQQN